MSSKRTIASLAIAGVGFAGYSALWIVPAFATSGTTQTVSWLMPKGATATNPLWPQDLLEGAVPCGRVAQKDVYTTDKKDDESLKMSAQKRLEGFIAEITADKKLTWSHGMSEDSALAAKYGVKIAWSFVDGKCSSPSPSKTSEAPSVPPSTQPPSSQPPSTSCPPTTQPPTTNPPTTQPPSKTAEVYKRDCATLRVKLTGIVEQIQVKVSMKIDGVAQPEPTYSIVDGLHVATFSNVPQGAFNATITVSEENANDVSYNLEVKAATGCSTSTPTTPVVNPPVVNPPTKAKTKATVEAISTQHPGIGG